MAFDPLAAMGRRAKAAELSITMIDIANLEPSEANFYRVKDDPEIEKQNEQTKASIEMYGVKQPIIVRPIENGRYKITTGERRYLLCSRLVEEGKEQFRMMPCIITTPQSKEDEQIELIITNQYREKNLAEKIEEVKQLTELLETKKARGEKMPGRMNEVVADMLNISRSEVGRLRQIDKNLQPELKEALKENKMAMTTAVELSKLPPEDQKAVYEQTGGEVKTKEVKQMKQEEPKREPENMNLDGFEPLPKPEPEKQEEDPEEEETLDVASRKIWAAKTMQYKLEKELEEYTKQLEQARENGNPQGAAKIETMIEYIGSLLAKVQEDLESLKGQNMFKE